MPWRSAQYKKECTTDLEAVSPITLYLPKSGHIHAHELFIKGRIFVTQEKKSAGYI